jgi:hypothetical protein
MITLTFIKICINIHRPYCPVMINLFFHKINWFKIANCLGTTFEFNVSIYIMQLRTYWQPQCITFSHFHIRLALLLVCFTWTPCQVSHVLWIDVIIKHFKTNFVKWRRFSGYKNAFLECVSYVILPASCKPRFCKIGGYGYTDPKRNTFQMLLKWESGSSFVFKIHQVDHVLSLFSNEFIQILLY